MATQILVVKFGGKSLATPDRIKLAVSKVVEAVRKGYKIVVVVSAIGDTTDRLIELLESVCEGRGDPRFRDEVLSMGERLSARLFAASLKSTGLEARFLDPRDDDWPIITDEAFGDASPLDESIERINMYVKPLIDSGIIPVIPGFIGRSRNGCITTLGRGGSDTTAFLVAKGLSADQVILVTDVDGIMTADPKIVSNPKRIDAICVHDLSILADVGAKFIHKKALAYKDPSIDVKVLSFKSASLEDQGTIIKGGFERRMDVTQVYDKPIGYITILGEDVASHTEILCETLSIIGSTGSMLGLSCDNRSIIVYMPEDLCIDIADRVHRLVEKYSGKVKAIAVRRGLCMLAVRGFGLEESPGIIASVSKPLSEKNINIHGVYTVSSTVFILVDWSVKDVVFSILKSVFDERWNPCTV
ncbi:MAG: aspartate kinase [Nitrososphaerota archaeon]|nr:aspartate kinase [Candidatus Bathyarchaeota archaeon]MDW8061095.1 aspartate kinase [Nitrososphaerota archaeon]